ncbi:MAG: TatD family deoxyribonuclease [Chloroflexi bacterium]|nr:MAG: TatD family deoxyribonuclease [Chloroflexota bacterium]
MLVDTHCHLNFERYDEDRPQVIQRAVNAGVTRIIIPAIDLPSSHEAFQLASEYEEIFAAVGIHPNSSADFQAEILGQIEALAQESKVVAIGEIGLDYYWDKSPKQKQRWALESQLELAAKLELPVIIHNREASEDVMGILEAWANTLPKRLQERAGVLHSFSATMAIAERALAAGFYLGFTGPITFKKTDELRAIAAQIPLDRILVETDGPFLTPHPYRGKRNEPSYIPYIVEQLAQLHSISSEEMGQITTQNAQRLFKLS